MIRAPRGETLITGLYCVYEPAVVARLQGEAMRQLTPMVGFLVDAGMLTADGLAESIQRLDLGAPVIAIGLGGPGRGLRPGQVLAVIGRVGQDS